jgi:peptide chain release factor 1
MLDILTDIEARHARIQADLSDLANISDLARLKSLSKEIKDLAPVVATGKDYRLARAQFDSTKEILAQESDEDMREMAKEELDTLEQSIEKLEEKLKQLLIPKDPNDDKNVILEIRAGTGGDEAALFAGDLFRMYQRFCEVRRWKFDVTDFHEGAAGGYRDVTIAISGEDCFGTLKFESGVHRVQRVPDTETQGRVHTSAATVAVMPEAEDYEVEIKDADIRKDTFCSSGNGGQSVNTTYSAVRLTHIPTGIVVNMQNERSQIKNYALALKVLKARMYDMEMQKRNSETSAMRQTLVSSGDRSAKIRTYNFPQSRVTDHRIGLTVHNLPTVLSGEVGEFIDALRLAENATLLAEGARAAS